MTKRSYSSSSPQSDLHASPCRLHSTPSLSPRKKKRNSTSSSNSSNTSTIPTTPASPSSRFSHSINASCPTSFNILHSATSLSTISSSSCTRDSPFPSYPHSSEKLDHGCDPSETIHLSPSLNSCFNSLDENDPEMFTTEIVPAFDKNEDSMEIENLSDFDNDTDGNRTPVPSSSGTGTTTRSSSSIVSSLIEQSTALLGTIIRATFHLPFPSNENLENYIESSSASSSGESVNKRSEESLFQPLPQGSSMRSSSLAPSSLSSISTTSPTSSVSSSSSKNEFELAEKNGAPIHDRKSNSPACDLEDEATPINHESHYQNSPILYPEPTSPSDIYNFTFGIEHANPRPAAAQVVLLSDEENDQESSSEATDVQEQPQIFHPDEEDDIFVTPTSEDEQTDNDGFDAYHFSSFGFHSGEQYTSEDEDEDEEEDEEGYENADQEEDDDDDDDDNGGYGLLYPHSSAWSPTSHDFFPSRHFSDEHFASHFLAVENTYLESMGPHDYMSHSHRDRILHHLVLSGSGILSRPTSMIGISSQLGNYIPDHELEQMTYEDFLELGERIGYVKTPKRKRVELSSCSFDSLENKDAIDLQCTICLSEYHTSDLVSQFPLCFHVFHTECLKAWINEHSTCPICRKDAA